MEDKDTVQLLHTLISSSKQLVIGAYDAVPEPFLGPLINEAAVCRVLEMQEKLSAHGGKVLLAARQLTAPLYQTKNFITPGIIGLH